MDFTPQEKQVFARMGRRKFEGKTPQEISKIMSEVRKKGIANKKTHELQNANR